MSFTKKLDEFLLEARKNEVIDDNIHQKLQNFAINHKNKAEISAFVNIIGFLGGLTVLLGLILIISHNWSNIANIVKISFYLISLAGIHLAAYFINDNHPKTSQILHFLGAGYVIAGIGLIAQIYHLSSEDGKSLLLWFIMIFPLAFILKHKWIGIMATFIFYAWLTINSNYYGHLKSIENTAIYFSTTAISLILIPRIIASFSDCLNSVKFFGIALLLQIVISMGFVHDMQSQSSLAEISLHPVTIILLVLNLSTLLYLLIRQQNDNSDRHLSLLLLITNLLPFIINKNNLIVISIIYWIIWFYFSAIMIYQGLLKGEKNSITLGSWCIVIGLIARFLDIIGTLLFTGSMFILFGIILIIAAYFGEHYRKYLINKITPPYDK